MMKSPGTDAGFHPRDPVRLQNSMCGQDNRFLIFVIMDDRIKEAHRCLA